MKQANPAIVKDTFAKGPEAWCSYAYHASMVADGRPIFILGTWLAAVSSDGFSFVGFSREVTGRLSMAQFEICRGRGVGSGRPR